MLGPMLHLHSGHSWSALLNRSPGPGSLAMTHFCLLLFQEAGSEEPQRFTANSPQFLLAGSPPGQAASLPAHCGRGPEPGALQLCPTPAPCLLSHLPPRPLVAHWDHELHDLCLLRCPQGLLHQLEWPRCCGIQPSWGCGRCP